MNSITIKPLFVKLDTLELQGFYSQPYFQREHVHHPAAQSTPGRHAEIPSAVTGPRLEEHQDQPQAASVQRPGPAAAK